MRSPNWWACSVADKAKRLNRVLRVRTMQLNLTQAVTQRYVLPELWDPVLLTVLLWPAFIVLAVPGLILFALGSLRRR